MAKTDSQAPLVWINTTRKEPRLPRNGPVRRQIRKQAMSLIAADRQHRGAQTRTNVGQLPSDVYEATVHRATDSSPTLIGCVVPKRISCGDELDHETRRWDMPSRQFFRHDTATPSLWAWSQEVPRSMPASGYVTMRNTHEFDPIDLSALTSFPVGQASIKEIHEQPSKLAKVLQCRQWSYFTYLPAIYGQSQCLDTALHCVAARTRQYLRGDNRCPDQDVAYKYSLAIQSLQDALNHPVKRLTAETLAACAVLAIHEVLSPPALETWKRHIAGASMLIRLRGPSRFDTPLEKALLLAFVGPIYTEAMLDAEACFLDEPEWQTALASSMLEYTSYSECSEIYVSVWLRVVRIPRLLLHVQNAVQYPDLIPSGRLEVLREQGKSIMIAAKEWKHDYDELVQGTAVRPPEEQARAKFDRRFEALGVYLASMVMLNRAMAALDLMQGPKLESEAEVFVERIVALEAQSNLVNPRAHLFTAFKMIVATAFRATSEQWMDAYKTVRTEAGNTKLVAWPLFKHWIELKGRKSEISSVAH